MVRRRRRGPTHASLRCVLSRKSVQALEYKTHVALAERLRARGGYMVEIGPEL